VVHFADGEQILWGGGAATWGEWEEEEVSGDLVVYSVLVLSVGVREEDVGRQAANFVISRWKKTKRK
jgi:hypothetical protein